MAERSKLILGNERLEAGGISLIEDIGKLLSQLLVRGDLRDCLRERRNLLYRDIGVRNAAEVNAFKDTLLATEPAAEFCAQGLRLNGSDGSDKGGRVLAAEGI